MSGTLRSRLGLSPSRTATIALVTRFLAPRTSMRPFSGRPPRMTMRSPARPTLAPARLASCRRELTLFHRQCLGPPGFPAGFEFCDALLVAQSEADVVEPLDQPPTSVIVDAERNRQVAERGDTLDEIDGDADPGLSLDGRPQSLRVVLGDLPGKQALLPGVAPEDVAEAGAEHGP